MNSFDHLNAYFGGPNSEISKNGITSKEGPVCKLYVYIQK